MAADNYALVADDGLVTNVLVVDPDATDLPAFAEALGASRLVCLADFADGAWGIGDHFVGGRVFLATPEAAIIDTPMAVPTADPRSQEVVEDEELARKQLLLVSTGLRQAAAAGWLTQAQIAQIVSATVGADVIRAAEFKAEQSA